MKEEKVRIRVRLTKANMSASSAGAFTRNQNPRMCFGS